MKLEEIYEEYDNNFKNGILPYIKCNNCSYSFYYPRNMCPECGSSDIEIKNSTGNGKVYAYTIFNGEKYGIITMDENFRFYCGITGDGADTGKKIKIVFPDNNGKKIPYAKLI